MQNPGSSSEDEFANDTNDKFISVPILERLYSHLMNIQIRIRAARAVKEYIKAFPSRIVNQKDQKVIENSH